MAHVAPIYPNFARGEVSPLMFGRIDIEQYPTCLDKCRNTYIRPYGCATRLTGTEFISDTKNSGKVRLLKFVFSATDSYIIECGAGYFRFYQDGAPIMNGANPYEIVNDYYEDQLDTIQYVQLDDVIKLTCLPHNGDNSTAKPKELIRTASNNWTFQNVTFKETPYLDQNTTDITITPSATTGSSITLTASADYFTSSMVGANMWIGTKVTDSATNKDVQGYVKITAYTDAKHVTASVQSTLSGASATKLWGEGAFSDYRGYPSCVALYDGRLWYGRTPTQPRNLYGSKPYAYETFTPAVDNEDDAGINIQLATNANGDGSDIKWIIGASYLLCGTYGGEFVIRGTGDGAITATDISARQRTNWGGEPVQPIVAGTFVHFLQRNGNKLRQFQYDFYYDSYKAVDVSIFSEHLLSSPIKEMALQKNPDSIIYLMREDGNVVMLTLEQDQSVQAWSLLEELGAKVESIQTIPSYNGNFDEVYMIMNRNTLTTTRSITSSNPSLTVSYSSGAETQTEGINVITLTYNEFHDVWVSSEEIQNETDDTKFSATSTNPNLVLTITGDPYPKPLGVITETLKFTFTEYLPNLDILRNINTPVFDYETGIASGFDNGNYVIDEATDSFIVKFKTGSDTTTRQAIGSITVNDPIIPRNPIFIENGKIFIGSPSTTYKYNISPNADYWIKYENNKIYLSANGTDYSEIQTLDQPNGGIETLGANGSSDPFKGSIDLFNSSVTANGVTSALASATGNWISQKTGQTVTLNTPFYPFTCTGSPVNNDTITCIWETIEYAELYKNGITSITGTPEDEDVLTITYTTTYSGSHRFIERMCNPITPDNPYDWWYVRSGLKYDGYAKTSGIDLTLSGNTGTVTATATDSIFTSSMVGNRIRFIDTDYNILGEGVIKSYSSIYASSTTVTLEITTYFQSLSISGGEWGISTDTVSGLSHLKGRTVQVFADGIEQSEKVVSSGGNINVDDAFLVVVGLGYTSYITTMPMEAGSQNGTAVGKRKRISEMAIRVWNSLGVRVGRNLNKLYDTIYKQKEPFTGVIPNIKYNQGWVWDANITVEQSHPYPMNILSIAPIVTEVDK